ncbi:MAG: L-rhamnose isomerase, partial [Anaerolineae bacterium]|nr:L-rhamnose isomerase [Anaerolineae bacterium]
MTRLSQAYQLAREQYAELGVDTDAALKILATIPISLHCWQGDDVAGFEDPDRGLSGGIMATGNYPGKARNADELRADLDVAYSLIPGTHRLNLHAIYGDSDGKMDRNDWRPHHFDRWIDWAWANDHGIDFNPSCFSHPMAEGGFTLASLDETVRAFWIEHCINSREIGGYIGKQLDNPCINNVWIPDGYKDTPVDRLRHRELLKESLDEVFSAEISHPDFNRDAVECKLFGIGSESYVVGSHEFYMGYAIQNQTLLTLDAGHFHPTETIADKISSTLLYVPELLLHVSRGVRWDSDHVVTLTDDLQAIMQEIVRHVALDRVHIGLDFFDASINRIAAWTIGTRNALKALLMALLEPIDTLRELEAAGDWTARLALLEELKMLPFGAVWDAYCAQQNTPVGYQFMQAIRHHEQTV